MRLQNYILFILTFFTFIFGIFFPVIIKGNLVQSYNPSLSPVTLKYYTTPNTIVGYDSCTSVDTNNDGKIDALLLGGLVYGTTDTGIILCVNSTTGVEVWRREKSRGNNLNPLELYDIDEPPDGIPEVFSCWGDSSHGDQKGMICLNVMNGSSRWINWDAMPAWHHFVIIADKSTNVPYVFFNGDDSTMNKMDARTGTIMKTVPSGLSCNGGLSAANINNDGNVEIILGLHPSPGFVCYNTNLDIVWQSNVNTCCSTQCPALVDVTGDGILDVISLYQSNPNGQNAGLNVINGATGQRIASMSAYDLGFGISAHSQGSVADFDYDGFYEITTGYESTSHIVRIKSPPELVATLTAFGMIDQPPMFEDIVGDSFFEILDNYYALNHTDYQIIPGVNLDLWSSMMADIDNDGLLELFGPRNGQIIVYDTEKLVVPGINPYTAYYGYRRLNAQIPYEECPGSYWYSWNEWSKPTIDLINPKNQSNNASPLPRISIYANDHNGDNLTVNWYENTSGTWVLQQTNINVPANSKVDWQYTNASTLQQKYWWKVIVNDGTNTISSWFCFTTHLSNQQTDILLKPKGSIIIIIGQKGIFYTKTTVPDDNKIQYRFDWDASGTNKYSPWITLVNSGQTINKNYAWDLLGIYIVKTQARDEHRAMSIWSNGMTVIVIENHPQIQH